MLKRVVYAIWSSMFTLGLLVAPGQALAADADSLVLRLGHPMAPGKNVSEGYEKFKALVEEKSRNKIRIEIFGDTRIGSDSETLNATLMGHLDMTSCSTPNLSAVHSSFMALDLPYITSQKYQKNFQKALDEGPLGQYLHSIVEELSLKVIMFSEYGYRHFVSSRQPLRSAADLKGLNVRTTDSPVEVAVAEALGMNPAPVPWGKTYAALQQGALHAEGNTFSLLHAGKHYEVLRYGMNSGHNYSLHILLMNKSRWDGLTLQQKQIIGDAASEALQWQRSVSEMMEKKAWQDMENKGMQITRLGNAELQQLKELTAGVREKYSQQIPVELLRLIEETQK